MTAWLAIGAGAFAGATCAAATLSTFRALTGRTFELAGATAVWVFALLLLFACESVLALAWRRRTSAAVYVAPAGIVGLVFGLALAGFLDLCARDEGGPQAGPAAFAALGALCCVSAAIAGLTAWLVLRPDRTNPTITAP